MVMFELADVPPFLYFHHISLYFVFVIERVDSSSCKISILVRTWFFSVVFVDYVPLSTIGAFYSLFVIQTYWPYRLFPIFYS